MILAFDTYYFDNKAKTVCLSFHDWKTSEDFEIVSEITEGVAEYVSGAFYKRELPCILSLLKNFDLNNVEVIIIDGYVFLDDDHQFGLGAYLYGQLNKKVPIIGVAKSNFASIHQNKRLVFRGESTKPLYVTAIGIDLELAQQKIESMHGTFRIPTLLKELDKVTREQ